MARTTKVGEIAVVYIYGEKFTHIPEISPPTIMSFVEAINRLSQWELSTIGPGREAILEAAHHITHEVDSTMFSPVATNA